MQPRSPRWPSFLLSSLVLLAAGPLLHAQPSGGPYGPQAQTYEVPKDAAHVYYVAADAAAEAAGTLEAPTSLEAAIAKVVTGDAIILHGGTYRTGGLILNQGVTLQPYRDEKPIIKGTLVATKWEAQGNGMWRTSWDTFFPMKPQDWWRRNREGRKTPLWLFNNDMVFVDGKALKAVGWDGAVDADSYLIDYEKKQIYIGVDPTNRLVEITAHDSAIVRTTTGTAHGKAPDKKGYTFRGLTFTQYAYRALEIEGSRSIKPGDEPTDDPVGVADPATFGKAVVGTTIEDCAITHCSRVAGYFRGDHFTMRNCLISDTSTEGLYLLASSDCLLERNIFTHNNVEQITGYYASAVKIFNQTRRVVCRDNLIIDNPNSNGLWYDVGNVDGVFVDNWVENCVDGFFFEISKGVTVAGNVFVNCDKGIRILNSSNAKVYQNTFVNTVASFERNERSAVGDHFGWHPATGPDVDQREGHVFSGNLLVADARFPKALFRAEQAPVLKEKLTKPMFAATDNNLYVRPATTVAKNLVTWSPAAGDSNQYEFKSVAELQAKLSPYEPHSQVLDLEPGSVLQSPDLKNYALTRAVPVKAAPPAEIISLLGWPKQDSYAPGAYQTK
jgi:parallel beta-helix repeat protein